MKNLVVCSICMLIAFGAIAQPKPTDLDKSPLDISYFPANYPILKMSGKTTAEPLVRVIYSRPQKKGRTIFGGEVKYNDMWRIGANESTEIEFFKNATFGNKKVVKGRYSLYCIPNADKWTLILNKDVYSWGSFSYRSSSDVVRCDVPVQTSDEEAEALTIYFDSTAGNKLIVWWEKTKVAIPVSM